MLVTATTQHVVLKAYEEKQARIALSWLPDRKRITFRGLYVYPTYPVFVERIDLLGVPLEADRLLFITEPGPFGCGLRPEALMHFDEELAKGPNTCLAVQFHNRGTTYHFEVQAILKIG